MKKRNLDDLAHTIIAFAASGMENFAVEAADSLDILEKMSPLSGQETDLARRQSTLEKLFRQGKKSPLREGHGEDRDTFVHTLSEVAKAGAVFMKKFRQQVESGQYRQAVRTAQHIQARLDSSVTLMGRISG